MDANDLFPDSEFLKSEDVENMGGEWELTIKSVGRREYERDGKMDIKGLLSFAETEKQLATNSTNTHTLTAMFGGKDIDKVWVGKKIILYVDPHVKYAGKEVKGIRVRLIDKKQDVITQYWSKTRELGMTQKDGLDHLNYFGKDFEKALAGLEAPK